MATATLTFASPGPTALVVTSCTRTDTGATVAASVTGSGVTWTLTVTEPAPGLVYAYLLAGTWADGSTGTVSGTVAGTGSPAGIYWTLSDLRATALNADLVAYSNDGSESDPTLLNAAQVQYWGDKADQWIDREWTHAGLTPASPVPTTDGDFPALTECAAQWTVAQLYRRRGVADKGTDSDGKMAELLKGAKAMLSAVIKRRQQEGEAPIAVRERTPAETYRAGFRRFGNECGLDGICGAEF